MKKTKIPMKTSRLIGMILKDPDESERVVRTVGPFSQIELGKEAEISSFFPWRQEDETFLSSIPD